jgi:hypothetical protein
MSKIKLETKKLLGLRIAEKGDKTGAKKGGKGRLP